ncbi:MAG: flagellar hook-basal body complex protein FliE [Syntrophomonadaceae bacterium]|nr:flagellar hook-basal body complex protein FliE [Syntrophomonadaceae bacterium]
MRVDAISSVSLFRSGLQETEQQPEISFSSYLKEALNQVSYLENQARSAAIDIAVGDASQIHQVMIAYEKASLALSLTIEVRNKIVEAYQEIMRIQM